MNYNALQSHAVPPTSTDAMAQYASLPYQPYTQLPSGYQEAPPAASEPMELDTVDEMGKPLTVSLV